MPRPTLPAGRPGTPVIPGQALAMHRRVSTDRSLMPYQVRAKDPDRKVTNQSTGLAETVAGSTTYQGPARMHPVPLNEQKVNLVGQAEQTSRWYLRVPLGAVIRQNTRVHVDECDEDYGDPALVGRVFRVLDDTPRVFGTELRVTVNEEPVPRAT